MSEKREKQLTELQEKFCQEYVVDFCGSRAAIRAGYKSKYADRYSYTLLQNPKIQERLKEISVPIKKKKNRTEKIEKIEF